VENGVRSRKKDHNSGKDALNKIYKEVKVVQINLFEMGGENGTGGKPLKRRADNPYLEIDLIDPTDPILFEGEI